MLLSARRRTGAGPSTSPSETAYAWSGERLTGLTGPGGSSSFVYDASGQRTRSVTTSGSITTTTTWTYDGLRLLGLSAARSDATTYTLDYLYDERGVVFAGIYASSETTPVPFLMVTTDRGDVRELLDTAGFGFAHHVYDPYGVPTATYSAGTSLVGSATADLIASRQPLRYASYTLDEASGLYYCSQRYYDPSVAAFISKDPARADGEESAYQYCGGDPVGKTDPSGLKVTHFSTKPTYSRWRVINCKVTRLVAKALTGRAFARETGLFWLQHAQTAADIYEIWKSGNVPASFSGFTCSNYYSWDVDVYYRHEEARSASRRAFRRASRWDERRITRGHTSHDEDVEYLFTRGAFTRSRADSRRVAEQRARADHRGTHRR